MRRFLTGYAVSYNLRDRRHGHLFQNRYKSIVCDGDTYFTELVRYLALRSRFNRSSRSTAVLRSSRYRQSCRSPFKSSTVQCRPNQSEAADERILGSGDFVKRVIRDAEARMQRQYTTKERGQRVERLIAEECKKRKVSLTELRNGSRRGAIPTVRAQLSRKLVEDFGIPMAEIARQVGVSTSAISKSLARDSS